MIVPVAPKVNHRDGDSLARCVGDGHLEDGTRPFPGLLDTALGSGKGSFKSDSIFILPTWPVETDTENSRYVSYFELDQSGNRLVAFGDPPRSVSMGSIQAWRTSFDNLFGVGNRELVERICKNLVAERFPAFGGEESVAYQMMGVLQENVVVLVGTSYLLYLFDTEFEHLAERQHWIAMIRHLVLRRKPDGLRLPTPADLMTTVKMGRILFQSAFLMRAGFLDGMGRMSAIATATMNLVPRSNVLSEHLPIYQTYSRSIDLENVSVVTNVRLGTFALVSSNKVLTQEDESMLIEQSHDLQGVLDASTETSLTDVLKTYLELVPSSYNDLKYWAPPYQEYMLSNRTLGRTTWMTKRAAHLWAYIGKHGNKQMASVFSKCVDRHKEKLTGEYTGIVGAVMAELSSWLSSTILSSVAAEKHKITPIYWVTFLILECVFDDREVLHDGNVPENYTDLLSFVRLNGMGVRPQRTFRYTYPENRANGIVIQLQDKDLDDDGEKLDVSKLSHKDFLRWLDNESDVLAITEEEFMEKYSVVNIEKVGLGLRQDGRKFPPISTVCFRPYYILNPFLFFFCCS